MKFSFILTLLAVVNMSWSQEIFDQTLDDALQSSVLEKSQIELIKQELRIQSIFIEGVKEIEIETGKPTLESDSSNKLKRIKLSQTEKFLECKYIILLYVVYVKVKNNHVLLK